MNSVTDKNYVRGALKQQFLALFKKLTSGDKRKENLDWSIEGERSEKDQSTRTLLVCTIMREDKSIAKNYGWIIFNPWEKKKGCTKREVDE